MPEQTYAECKTEERRAAILEAARVHKVLVKEAKALAKNHGLRVSGEQWSGSGYGGVWLEKGSALVVRLDVTMRSTGYLGSYTTYVKMARHYAMRQRPYVARCKAGSDLQPYIERMRQIVDAGIQYAKVVTVHAKAEKVWQKKVLAMAKDLGMPTESDYLGDFTTSADTDGYYRTKIEGVDIVLRMLGDGARVEIETAVDDLADLRQLLAAVLKPPAKRGE